MAFAEAEGLLIRSLAGDVMSLCPPLVITPQELDELFDRLDACARPDPGLGQARGLARELT